MDSARDLASRLASLLRREHGAMADFLLVLADFDAKRSWEELGHTSLFHFLHRELKLSAGAAFHRKTAAELIQRFPEVADPLRDGRLCLSSVVEVAKVVTRENVAQVLPRFFHASKQEAKAVAAELAPREVLPQRVVVTAVARPAAANVTATRLPAPAAAPPLPTLALGQALHPGETVRSQEEAPLVPPPTLLAPAPAPRSSTEPLTADLRRLHVTVSKRFTEKLEAAREALSHSHPGADVEAILEAGLDLLLERAAKRKGLVKRPRAAPVPAAAAEGANPRHVPAAVRREVFLRDEGKCQWPLAEGGICGSTHRVELDHIVPVGRGGKATVANLRVLCSLHNNLAAREVYGDEWMDQFTRGVGCQSTLHTSGP
ncbi:MAG TPA: HNH endonuclease signature motif containing protein [Anaeromyxobacteraceae bacterium]|nr:HNH endonuclease signature motif containing protein [Anaeromyxobacteraceae bacterium]